MAQTANRPLWGVFWMFVTGLFFVGVTAVVNHLGDALPAAQSAFLRFLIGLLFLVPLLGAMRGAAIRPHLKLIVLRSAVHLVGVILWFFAMARITMAEVTAMNFLIPVYVTIGAGLFLGERLAARRLIAVAAALIGALLILRPGFRELSAGHIAMLGTALMLASSYLLAKSLSDRLSPAAIVGSLSLAVTIGLAPLAWWVWVPPSWTQLGWLCLVAFFATAGHYTMTLAFRAAPVSVTQPVTFLQLIWSVLFGWAVFGEGLDPWVITGGTIIVAAASFISWREAVLRRQATPHANAPKV